MIGDPERLLLNAPHQQVPADWVLLAPEAMRAWRRHRRPAWEVDLILGEDPRTPSNAQVRDREFWLQSAMDRASGRATCPYVLALVQTNWLAVATGKKTVGLVAPNRGATWADIADLAAAARVIHQLHPPVDYLHIPPTFLNTLAEVARAQRPPRK